MNPEECWTFLENGFVPEGMKEEQLPDWVFKLREMLFKTVLKEIISLKDEVPSDAEVDGILIGASFHFTQLVTKMCQIISDVTGTEFNDSDKQEIIEYFSLKKDFKKNMEEKIEQASQEEYISFHKGKAKGANLIYDTDGQLKHGEINTHIKVFLLMNWPFINESVKTRKALYNLLFKNLGKTRVGSFDRIQKFLIRIGFNPAKPGRPKKK